MANSLQELLRRRFPRFRRGFVNEVESMPGVTDDDFIRAMLNMSPKASVQKG